MDNNFLIGISAVNINGVGINSADKVKTLENDFKNSNSQILFIFETKVTKLETHFYQIFTPSHYDLKFTNAGQGMVSIVKNSNLYRYEIQDISVNACLAHKVTATKANSTENSVVIGLYQPPSRPFAEALFSKFEEASVVLGDFNCYLDGLVVSDRERQLREWLALESNDFINITTQCTWKTLTRQPGPDLCLIKTSLIDTHNPTCALTKLYADHFGLILSSQNESTQPIFSSKKVMSFNYNKFNQAEIDAEFENLSKPTIHDLQKIWQKLLVQSRLYPTGSNPDTKGLENTLHSLTDQSEIETFVTDFCFDANNSGQTGKLFQIINFLTACKDGSDSPTLKVRALPEENSEWESFREQISTAADLQPGTAKQLYRCRRYWYRSVKNGLVELFTMREYNAAWSSLNKHAVGPDRVNTKWFPRSEKGKKAILYAINGLMNSTKHFHPSLLRSRLQFIPKSGNKLRPLCQVNRINALMDRMVACRLDALLRKLPAYHNRHGFLKNRSVDTLLDELNLKILQGRNQGYKCAIINLDQSSAYNLVCHAKLVIKLTRLVKMGGDRGRFSIILGYVSRWLGGGRRTVKFGRQKCKVKRGVPQGSPLSCTCYVAFFDYECGNGSGESFEVFADDSDIMVIKRSWSEVDSKVDENLAEFNAWCIDNAQQLNLSKSKVLYIGRKQPPSDVACTVETNALKSLGIWIDSRFTFNKHVDELEKWTKIRCNILKMLRYRLKFSYKSLFTVVKCWRIKLLFGSSWLLNLADSNMKRISNCFTKLVKAAAGLTRLVSTETSLKTCGLPSFDRYLEYWFTIKQFESRHTDSGIFNSARAFRDTVRPSSYNRRESTAQKSELSIQKQSAYPNQTFKWLKSFDEWRPFLENIVDGEYKMALKKRMFDTEITKKHNDKEIAEIIQKLNDEAYSEICV